MPPDRELLYDQEEDIYIIRENDPESGITSLTYLLPDGEEFTDTFDQSGQGIGDTPAATNLSSMLETTSPTKKSTRLQDEFFKRHPSFAVSAPEFRTHSPGPSDEVANALRKTGKTPSQLADDFKFALARREAQSIEKLGNAQLKIWEELRSDADALSRQIDGDWKRFLTSQDYINKKKDFDDGVITQEQFDEFQNQAFRGQLTRLSLLEDMERQLRDDLMEFVDIDLLPELRGLTEDAMIQGQQDAIEYIKVGLPGDLGELLDTSFSRPSVMDLQNVIFFVQPDSPIFKAIQSVYSTDTAKTVSEKFLNGIARGWDPRKITRAIDRNVKDGLGDSFNEITKTVRTMQNKAYQKANHQTFQENSDVVKGWIWTATLDDRTCINCINMNGTEHDITEELNDHNSGRCVPIPITPTWADLGIEGFDDIDIEKPQSGREWLESQSEAQQIARMGRGRWDMWQEAKEQGMGDEFFKRMSTSYEDKVWGVVNRPTSLKSLRQGMGGVDINLPQESIDPFASRLIGREFSEDVIALTQDLESDSQVYVQRALSQIPVEHLSRVNSVSSRAEDIIPNAQTREFDFLLPDGKTAGALFDVNTGDMAVHPLTARARPSDVVHEVGHSFYGLLEEEETFGKFLDGLDVVSDVEDIEQYGLREYSKTNVKEFLADTYVVNILGDVIQRQKLADVLKVNDLMEMFK